MHEAPGASQGVPERFTRTCIDCYQLKSIDEFHAKTKWPSGRTRTWQSYCKDCQRERVRFSAQLRRRRQGVPEHQGRAYRIRGGHHESGYQDLVPAGPFIAWLQTHLDAAKKTQSSSDELTRIARAAEVDLERLRKLKDGMQEQVTLGYVDRIMIASQTVTALWELYDFTADQRDTR